MKLKENGYKGYNFNIIAEQDKFKVDIEHLDWLTIKKNEDENQFFKYKTGLGLFIGIQSKSSKFI